jgi:hypothetical protein
MDKPAPFSRLEEFSTAKATIMMPTLTLYALFTMVYEHVSKPPLTRIGCYRSEWSTMPRSIKSFDHFTVIAPEADIKQYFRDREKQLKTPVEVGIDSSSCARMLEVWMMPAERSHGNETFGIAN